MNPAPLVIGRVAAECDTTVAAILGRRRLESHVYPRQLAMWLLRTTFGWSYARIGAALGRDHGTAMWAVRATADRMDISDFWHDLAHRLHHQLK